MRFTLSDKIKSLDLHDVQMNHDIINFQKNVVNHSWISLIDRITLNRIPMKTETSCSLHKQPPRTNCMGAFMQGNYLLFQRGSFFIKKTWHREPLTYFTVVSLKEGMGFDFA